jgi:arginyl-tRNA synthetase
MTNNIEQQIRTACAAAVKELYNADIELASIAVERTNKDQTGDYTVVVFPLLRVSKKKPEETANDLGAYLQANVPQVSDFNVIKGFLNLSLTDSFWIETLGAALHNNEYGKGTPTDQKITVEYCGPNTNKPLHLGHIRNMLLGYSVASILAFAGNEVSKVNIYNDRGIAICKSMLAWQQFGNGETPESSGIKGDHLVGKYYVVFDKKYKEQVEQLKANGLTEDEAKKKAPIQLEVQAMLLKWEAGDAETIALWKQMNDWVYAGFQVTFDKMGVDFDRDYYESETYLLGRDLVLEGLASGVFFKKEDGSIWIDLTDKGLDQKVLLRSDGTSVYLTQDLGTADLRYDHYHMNRSVYVVADEQNYHFKVLQLTLEKLGKPYAAGIYHLSYGLVELPHGRMKSREGNVVDADDLIREMVAAAKAQTLELGKLENPESEEAEELFRTIGMGALKYFMLRVDPKKKMLFNPEESIDLQGQTGPYIQYVYTRCKSVVRNFQKHIDSVSSCGVEEIIFLENKILNEFFANYNSGSQKPLFPEEKELLKLAYLYPQIVQTASQEFDPALLAGYLFELSQCYNKFYHVKSILGNQDIYYTHLRILMSIFTARIIKSGTNLLGIDVPERM